MRKSFGIFGICFLGLLLSFFSYVPGTMAKELLIGINTPISGPAAPTGLGLSTGHGTGG